MGVDEGNITEKVLRQAFCTHVSIESARWCLCDGRSGMLCNNFPKCSENEKVDVSAHQVDKASALGNCSYLENLSYL